MSKPDPFRKVTGSTFYRNPTNGAGGTRVETLSCGHRWVGKQSVPPAKRRRCRSCAQNARRDG